MSAVALPPGWTLTGLPSSVVREFERLARHVIQRRFVPRIWLKNALRRREELTGTRSTADKSSYPGHRPSVFGGVSALHAPRRSTGAGLGLLQGRGRSGEGAEDPIGAVRRKKIMAAIQTSALLSNWPEDVLRDLVDTAYQISFEHGEIMMHQGEFSSGALVFVMEGTCRSFAKDRAIVSEAEKVLQAGPRGYRVQQQNIGWDAYVNVAGVGQRRIKMKGLAASRSAAQRQGPCTLIDFGAINNEPLTEFVMSSGTADLLMIPRSAVLDAFQRVPVSLAQRLVVAAKEIRAERLPRTFPMTESRVRVSGLFRDLPSTAIQLVLKHLKPRVVVKGSELCLRGKFAQEMIFLRRGMAGYRDTDAGGKKVILREGAAFGERELVFRERFLHTVVALSNVDLYTLRLDDLQNLRAMDSSLSAALDAAASREREAELLDGGRGNNNGGNTQAEATRAMSTSTMGRLSPSHKRASTFRTSAVQMVSQIPLLDMIADEETFQEIAALMKPRVFSARQLIVCTADHCDRLVYMSRGAATVRVPYPTIRKQFLHQNEWFGYTCLLIHRWEYSIVATEPVDVWEIPRAEFIQVLKRRKLYHKMLGISMQLLQPLLPFPHRSKVLEKICLAVPSPNSFPHMKTTNMHPVSSEDRRPLYAPWRPAEELNIFGEFQQPKFGRKPRRFPLYNGTPSDGDKYPTPETETDEEEDSNEPLKSADNAFELPEYAQVTPRGLHAIMTSENIINGNPVFDGESSALATQQTMAPNAADETNGKGGVNEEALADIRAARNANRVVVGDNEGSPANERALGGTNVQVDAFGNLVSTTYAFPASSGNAETKKRTGDADDDGFDAGVLDTPPPAAKQHVSPHSPTSGVATGSRAASPSGGSVNKDDLAAMNAQPTMGNIGFDFAAALQEELRASHRKSNAGLGGNSDDDEANHEEEEGTEESRAVKTKVEKMGVPRDQQTTQTLNKVPAPPKARNPIHVPSLRPTRQMKLVEWMKSRDARVAEQQRAMEQRRTSRDAPKPTSLTGWAPGTFSPPPAGPPSPEQEEIDDDDAAAIPTAVSPDESMPDQTHQQHAPTAPEQQRPSSASRPSTAGARLRMSATPHGLGVAGQRSSRPQSAKKRVFDPPVITATHVTDTYGSLLGKCMSGPRSSRFQWGSMSAAVSPRSQDVHQVSRSIAATMATAHRKEESERRRRASIAQERATQRDAMASSTSSLRSADSLRSAASSSSPAAPAPGQATEKRRGSNNRPSTAPHVPNGRGRGPSRPQ